MTKASVTTHDTTHQDEAPTTPLVYDTKSPEADPMAPPSYTSPDLMQFPIVVSHALVKAHDEDGETLPTLAARIGLTTEQALTCLETMEQTISSLRSTVAPHCLEIVSTK